MSIKQDFAKMIKKFARKLKNENEIFRNRFINHIFGDNFFSLEDKKIAARIILKEWKDIMSEELKEFLEYTLKRKI